jgi:hypothetical protein
VDTSGLKGLTAIDALFELGRREHIPFGIEYVDLDALRKPKALAAPRATVDDILRAIFPIREGYRWTVQKGVVVITNRRVPSGKRNLLNRVLPEFKTSRISLSDASFLLRNSLFVEVYSPPRPYGFIGRGSPGDRQNLVGPFAAKSVTVRAVLNRLVATNRNAAWIVRVPPRQMGHLTPRGLWAIVEYDNPPWPYAQMVRNALYDWGQPPSKKAN